MLLKRFLGLLAEFPSRSAWVAFAFVAAMTLLAAVMTAFRVVPIAAAAETSISALQQPSISSLASSGGSSLDEYRASLTEIEASLVSINSTMQFLERFSPALSWIPVLSSELQGAASQSERAQRDLTLAASGIEASASMLRVYESAQTAIVSPNAALVVEALRADAQKSHDDFSSIYRALSSPTRNGGANSLVTSLPPFNRYTAELADVESELISASHLGAEMSVLMLHTLDIASAIQPVISQFSGQGTDGPQIDSRSIRESLVSVDGSVEAALLQLEIVAPLLEGAEFDSNIATQLENLDTTLRAMQYLSRGASGALDALGPALDVVENSESGLLAPGGGLTDVFAEAARNTDALNGAASDLRQAQSLLASLPAHGSTAAGLYRIQRLTERMIGGLTLVSQIAPAASAILSSDEPTRFIVLGQSADELRATGGFVSSVWLVTINGGGLESIQYHDAVRVDDWDRLDLYPVAPTGLEEHMNGWVWLLRDVSWDPDFPTTARAAIDLFRLGQRIEADGVIAINQWTLLAIVDALGEVPTPDGIETITAENLVTVLEQGTDAYGRAYMDLVLQGFLQGLNQSTSLGSVLGLSSAVFDTLDARDTLLYSDDQAVQSAFESLGWDSAVASIGGDYLYVVDSNVGWSKVDRNIERTVAYHLDLTAPESPRATLRAGYTNHSGAGSAPCEPQWQNRGTDYSQLKNACYWNFVRVYIPQDARVLSHSSLPLSSQTVAVEIGAGIAGEETAVVGAAHGQKVFSALMPVEAGERAEVMLVYDLPHGVISSEADGLVYTLEIRKQPGVRQRDVEISVMPPAGYQIADFSHAMSLAEDGTATIDLDLASDTELRLEFSAMPKTP